MEPTDVASIDVFLSDEERAVRDMVRAFVRTRVLPSIGERFERGEYTSDLLPELGELGIIGMHLDGYGFSAASPVAYGLACAELEAGDSSLRQYASGLPLTAILRFGSEEHRQQHLPGLARGETSAAFALTEPDVGSNPGAMRTTARRDGADWVINGTKLWITSGHSADVLVVWARAEQGVVGFLVERGTPGLAATPMRQLYSMRSSPTSEVVLTDVRLPESARLPGAEGLGAPLSCLEAARYGISWGVTGAARVCFEAALEYSTTREQFGVRIGAFQMTQRKLADMAVQVSAAQLRALHIGRLKELGRLEPAQVSMAKLANCRDALAVARTARTVLGANGISLEYPVMRHLANLEAVSTYEGTEEMHSLVIGRALTGIGAFS